MDNGELTPRQQIYLDQLGRTQDYMKENYSVINQWVTILGGAWAALLTVGVQLDPASGILILASVAPLLVLAYELRRGGQTLAALASTALGLERELGIPLARSATARFFGSFREKDLIDKWYKLNEARTDAELLKEIQKRDEYSVFHRRRSWTMRMIYFAVVFQPLTVLIFVHFDKLQW